MIFDWSRALTPFQNRWLILTVVLLPAALCNVANVADQPPLDHPAPTTAYVAAACNGIRESYVCGRKLSPLLCQSTDAAEREHAEQNCPAMCGVCTPFATAPTTLMPANVSPVLLKKRRPVKVHQAATEQTPTRTTTRITTRSTMVPARTGIVKTAIPSAARATAYTIRWYYRLDRSCVHTEVCSVTWNAILFWIAFLLCLPTAHTKVHSCVQCRFLPFLFFGGGLGFVFTTLQAALMWLPPTSDLCAEHTHTHTHTHTGFPRGCSCRVHAPAQSNLGVYCPRGHT